MKRTPLYILPQTTAQIRPVAMHRHSVIVLTFFLAATLAQPAEAQLSRHRYGAFEENKGQFDSSVRYVARMPHVDIWITSTGLVYDVFRLDPDEKVIAEKRTRFGEEYESYRPDEPEPQLRSGQAIFVSYKNATSAPIFEAHKPVSGVFNYLSGGDGTGDVTGVERFSELYVRNVYTGIDARYYFDRGGFRYDFIVHPGADPAQIRMVYDGADVLLSANGELEFKTVAGTLKHGDLKTYSGKGRTKQAVASAFRVNSNEVSFGVAGYDKTEALVIDPLVFGTYFGSAGTDNVSGLHVYENGESLILGYAASHGAGIPTTPGVYLEFNPTNGEFLSRFSADGSVLVFSTYFGTGDYCGGSVAELKVQGSYIFVADQTSCVDAGTDGSFDTSHNGESDLLLIKFDERGTQKHWATYLGGERSEQILDVLIDENGAVVISGLTNSTDFPTTPGAYREQDHGIQTSSDWEPFVSKISGTGDQLLFSTYLGFEAGPTNVLIEQTSSGDLVVLSSTRDSILLSSSAFDMDLGDLNPFGKHYTELVVSVLTPDGTDILYQTYLGGSISESPTCLLTSETGEIWIAGDTDSPGFPLTHVSAGAILTPESPSDIFVVKLNGQASQILQGTRFGDQKYPYSQWLLDCTLIGQDEVAVVGLTRSSNFPVTPDALFTETRNEGGNRDYQWSDAFVSVISNDGRRLRYSTLLTGEYSDQAEFVREDGSELVVAGYTTSTDLPTTQDAVDTEMYWDGEFGDIFLLKFGFPESVPIELPGRPSKSRSIISLFPNPATENILVEMEVAQPAAYEIDLFSVLGQKMRSRTGVAAAGVEQVAIDIRGIPPGVYIVRSVIGEKLFESKQIVITR